MKNHLTADQPDPLPLPEGWSWIPFAQLLKLRKEFIQVSDSRVYRRVTVQLHGRGVIFRDEVLGAALKTKSQQIVRGGDFLVAEIDAKVGGFGIVPQEFDGSIVSSHYFTFEIDSSTLLPTYLILLIRTGFITQQILQFVRGSLNYAAVRPRHVLGLVVPLPPKSAQVKISDQLDLVDKMAHCLGEQLEAVESLPTAILRAALSHSEPPLP